MLLEIDGVEISQALPSSMFLGMSRKEWYLVGCLIKLF